MDIQEFLDGLEIANRDYVMQVTLWGDGYIYVPSTDTSFVVSKWNVLE